MKFPEFICIFYWLTGLYCPACGGTRSMKALFHGQPLLAVHENPASPFLVLMLVLWGIEFCFQKHGRNIKLFPRNAKFWNFLLILWLSWAVLRNCIPVLQPFTE